MKREMRAMREVSQRIEPVDQCIDEKVRMRKYSDATYSYIPLKTINSKSSKHNKNNNSNKRSKEAIKEVTRKCHTVQGNAKQQQDNSLDNSNMTGVKEVQGQ